MPWIIAIESGSPLPNGGGYVRKIYQDGDLLIGNNRRLAKEYRSKSLVDKTVQEVNGIGKMSLKAIEVSELKAL